VDRIRKALDLARADRVRLLEGPAPDIEPGREQPAVASASPETPPGDRAASVITYTRTRIYSPRETVLEANRVVKPAHGDTAAAAYRMLRTQVLQRLDERGWRSLAVLSPNSDDGKTTTAINLAVNLAFDNRHTVLLVDCDFRRPGIAASLDINPEFGLDDVLCGRASIEQCLYHPNGFDRLVILPARQALQNSSEALSSIRGRAFVSELRARYPERILLFDLPPIIGADDAIAFLPLVQCGLMVVAERSTRREDLVRCMELTRNTPIVGTVLNRSVSAVSAYR
jgi:Mrp family chromosome partitioning ATPase